MTRFFAEHLLFNGNIESAMILSVENGLFTAIEHSSEAIYKADYDHGLRGLVSPGFIDTQVNGGGSVLFNHAPSVDAIKQIVAAHAAFGSTTLLPTLITDKVDKMTMAANSIAEAIDRGIHGVAGIHFEGPHLGLAKKGIHAAQHVRQISDTELQLFTRKDIGKVILTLAPETVPCDEIRDLVSQGVIVSLGHSNASIEQVLNAIEAGAKGFTHLFNAMSGLKAREPGLIAAALVDDRMFSGLIADLHHVHPYNCKLAFQSIGPDRLMLVTDAMAQVGSDIDTLPWLDSTITRHDTKLTLDDGSLAGSCLDMATAVKNMHAEVSDDLPAILTMASKTPAQFLGLTDRGEIKVGSKADFVLLSDDLSCVSTWIDGVRL